jgi:hypothetical protein
MRRAIVSVAIAASFGLLAACTPPPVTADPPPAPAEAPVISGFAAVTGRAAAPAPVAVTFRVSDVNGGPLTCVLDDGPSGQPPRTIPNCEHRVSGEYDMPAAGTATWSLTATDSGGLSTSATTSLTLGSNPDPTDNFNITLRFAPGLPDWQIAAAQQAAANWEHVLRSGEPTAQVWLNGDTMDGLISLNGLAGPYSGDVDDVMIDVGPVPTTNGRGAYGEPGVRRSDGTTVYGVVAIGNADYDWNSQSSHLPMVLTHEMGHVLGIGAGDNWWNSPWLSGNFPEYSFTGPHASAQVPVTFDATQGIPLVDTGLPIGDIGAHPKLGVSDRSWTGQHFTTPDIMAECWWSGEVSRLSVGILRDLGYDTVPDSGVYAPAYYSY